MDDTKINMYASKLLAPYIKQIKDIHSKEDRDKFINENIKIDIGSPEEKKKF